MTRGSSSGSVRTQRGDGLKDKLRSGILSEESERDISVSDKAEWLKEMVMAEGQGDIQVKVEQESLVLATALQMRAEN